MENIPLSKQREIVDGLLADAKKVISVSGHHRLLNEYGALDVAALELVEEAYKDLSTLEITHQQMRAEWKRRGGRILERHIGVSRRKLEIEYDDTAHGNSESTGLKPRGGYDILKKQREFTPDLYELTAWLYRVPWYLPDSYDGLRCDIEQYKLIARTAAVEGAMSTSEQWRRTYEGLSRKVQKADEDSVGGLLIDLRSYERCVEPSDYCARRAVKKAILKRLQALNIKQQRFIYRTVLTKMLKTNETYNGAHSLSANVVMSDQEKREAKRSIRKANTERLASVGLKVGALQKTKL